MFDRVTQAAEKLATNVSRRAFLGRLGQGALAVVGVAAGMLAFGGEARAAKCLRVACAPGLRSCGPGTCCPANCVCHVGFDYFHRRFVYSCV
jgi:hypothetical protein